MAKNVEERKFAPHSGRNKNWFCHVTPRYQTPKICFGVDFCGVNVNEHSFWKNDVKVEKQKVEIDNTQNDGTCQVKQNRPNLCGNLVALEFGIWQ